MIWEGIFSRIFGEALAAGGGRRPPASPLLGSSGGEGGSEALLLAGDMWPPGECRVSPGASSALSGPRAAPGQPPCASAPQGLPAQGAVCWARRPLILLRSVHRLAAVSQASLPRSQALPISSEGPSLSFSGPVRGQHLFVNKRSVPALVSERLSGRPVDQTALPGPGDPATGQASPASSPPGILLAFVTARVACEA